MDVQQNSSDVIIKEIREQCRSEIATIEEQTAADLASRQKEIDGEVSRIQEALLKDAEIQAMGIRRKILSGLHLEIKKQAMNTREVLISRILEMLGKKITEFRKGQEYGPWLEKAVLQGVQVLEGDEVRILAPEIERKWLNQGTLARIEKGLKSQGRTVRLTLDSEVPTGEGVVLFSNDGRTCFDSRFQASAERLRDRMRLMIIKTMNME
jgi:vacuolar-type H+-ATPase subunit E/Vma4